MSTTVGFQLSVGCVSRGGCTGVFIFTDKSVQTYYGTAVDSLKEIDTQKTSVYIHKKGLSLSVRVMFVFIYTLLDCFGQKKGNLKKEKFTCDNLYHYYYYYYSYSTSGLLTII